MSEVIQKKRKREKEAERKQKCRKDPEFLEKERKRDKERKKWRRIEEKGREEALLYWQKRALVAERKVRRLQKEKEEEEASGEHKKDELIEFIPPHVHPVKESEKEEEEQEEEEEKAPKWRKMMPSCKVLMDPEVLPKLIPSSFDKFTALAHEFEGAIHNTTWRGTLRKNTIMSDVPASEFLFFTLFWLRNYPTLTLLSGLFHLHERTCTQILRCVTCALARILQGEITWPSDEEFEQLIFSTYTNGSFEEIVCVADGTEIEISRPSDPVIQRQTWSAKKKQNSLNVMIITKLNGEIIYFSPL